MAPDSGALQVLDLDVVAQPQAVAENLDLYADLHGIDAAERARQYPRLLEMTALAPFTKRHNRQRHLGFLPQDHCLRTADNDGSHFEARGSLSG